MPTKFDFLSPGIELREIDQSAVAAVPENDGLLLIGRAKKGPAMKPIKITSLADFQAVFGTPMDGTKRGDPWREGNTAGGGWAAYAAEAYLAARVGPVKFIRLAGVEENAGDAGWSVEQATLTGGIAAVSDVKGALGIFVAENKAASNGVLAAILYVEGSQLGLDGEQRDGTPAAGTYSSALAIKQDTNGWSAQLDNGTVGQEFDFTFNFDENSQNFIRNVLNTDATVFASGWNNHKVFLGESFEYNVQRLDASSGLIAWVAPIRDSAETTDFVNHKVELTEAKTGWFIGSNASSDKRLFRLCALDEGSDFHKTHIVRIKDLRKATTVRPEASFTIEIARAGQRPSEYVEKFVNITLNPDSPNYILKKIGDLNIYWDNADNKTKTEGSFTNQSNLVRVEIADGGVNKTDLPLGFLGPKKIANFTVAETDATAFVEWLWGLDTLPNGNALRTVEGLQLGDSIDITWPTHGLSEQNTNAGSSNYAPTAIYGLSYNSLRGQDDFCDIGILKSDYNPHLAYTAPSTDAAYKFSLENIQQDGTTGTYYHTNTFVVAFDDASTGALATGIKQFAAPFFGGTDGVDIKVENPFNNDALTNTPYAKYSMESAISMVADYYTSRYDLISIPGVTNSAINSLLVRQTEERGDALAIIDMQGIYVSAVDSGLNEVPGSVSTMVSTAEGGSVASSYAAAYYPNVRIADVSSGRGSVLMAPPSVAAIGAIAKSEALSQPWFAPAGFTRGGLAPLGGTGGANVVGTYEHLSKTDRDNLYNVNINPIARFPATGDTVIFGQKTLQPTDTALDRINVRRMMIYLKKRIGGIADQFLFEQGVQATYDRFKATIEPILAQVRSEFGITEYKVVLDETTTTPDLQDRNIMYAKVFVKPAKAIEYVVIDFVVTQTGVEF